MFFAALLLFCPCAPFDETSHSDSNLLIITTSVSSELPSAPDPKTALDPTPGTALIIPRTTRLPAPAGKGLFLRSLESPKEKKLWYALSIAGHSGAAFDAWSTRRAITKGHGIEANPLLKPFASSNAIYAATQLTPLVMDYVGRRMMFSRRNWIRRMWWVPQAAATSVSFGAAIHNTRIAN